LPSLIPRTVQEVLHVATTTRADGLTAPACALLDYYKTRQIVRFFLVVTDEIENDRETQEGYFFAQLFYRYVTEVSPTTKIVFVSFLENPKEKGRMVRSLESFGIIPIQFRLDARRPDLTKVDGLLGLLASETSFFSQICEDLANSLKLGSFKEAIDSLNISLRKTATSSTSTTTTTESVTMTTSSSSSTPSTSSQVVSGSSNLQPRNRNPGEEETSCIICMNSPATTALLECGHLSFCEDCAAPLVNCPICRNPVLRTLRIYRS